MTVARLIVPESKAEARSLNPGTVVAVSGSFVDVELPSGAAQARMALAHPYEPVVGDVLLVVSEQDAHYVIGVIDGRGKTSLSFQGDVELSAGGKLHMAAADGITMKSSNVVLQAQKLEIAAERLRERFGEVYQRVTSLLSIRAKRSLTVVDDDATVKAKNSTILAEETAAMNGKAVHLG